MFGRLTAWLSGSLVSLGLGFALFTGAAIAQDYPTKPIRLVVPFTAGGPTDLVVRLYAQQLSQRLGVQVLVDNKPGGGGAIGAQAVATAAPDGYTFLIGASGTHVINPLMKKDLGYDPIKDFAPLGLLVRVPMMMVSNKDLPSKSLPEMIELFKATPGKYSYASAGVGSAAHLAGELFKQMTGIDTVHIPYKGSVEVLADLMAGRVAYAFVAVDSGLPQVRADKVASFGLGLSHRLENVPDLPTMGEAGLPGFETYTFNAVFAPANTPDAVLERISKELNEIGKEPEIKKHLEDLGLEVVTDSSPAALGELVQSEITKWTPIVANLK